jgi:hypothetical protein
LPLRFVAPVGMLAASTANTDANVIESVTLSYGFFELAQ